MPNHPINPTGDTQHVLVIGGGIGGLCLAQGLTKAGISVAVYERDTSAHFRDQGYRISLKATGAQALHDCLPRPLFDLAVATSIRPATRMTFMDGQLNPKFAKPTTPAEPGLAGFGVNRLTLREILLAGLGDAVHFGKTFECFETTADGVRAHFTDGTTATGDLLVGADGTNSAVRGQLLPDAVIDELGWAIYGRTPIAGELLEATPDVLVDTFNRVTGPNQIAISIATCRTVEPVDRATARLAPTVRLTDIPGYFSWTMPLPGLSPRDSADLHRCALEQIRDLHPAVARIVAAADVPATFRVLITSARPVDPWHEPTVTLLGDAIHTMSPGRGDGANIALKDAGLLCAKLTQGGFADAKADYEKEMLRYGFAAVEASLNRPFAPPRSAPPPR